MSQTVTPSKINPDGLALNRLENQKNSAAILGKRLHELNNDANYQADSRFAAKKLAEEKYQARTVVWSQAVAEK